MLAQLVAADARRHGVSVNGAGLAIVRAHANTDHTQATTVCSPSWKGAFHAGRRVRARRDRTHPRRQARRAVDQTGDRDRALEGARGGSQAASTQEGDDIRAHAPRGAASCQARSASPPCNVVSAIECRHACLEAGVAGRRLDDATRAAGAACGATANEGGSECVGPQGVGDQRRVAPARGGYPACADAQAKADDIGQELQRACIGYTAEPGVATSPLETDLRRSG